MDADLWLPPTTSEQQELDKCAESLIFSAREKLSRAGSDLQEDMGLLFRRRAAIFSDPGWFEIEFSLNDVDTSVRKAGLDFDPGFLPWLSLVMRFKYA